MRKLASYFVVLIFAIQTAAICAQNPLNRVPKFSLTIFLFQNGGAESEMPGQPIFRMIRVEETNTSNESIFEAGCLELQGLFHISVLYNGVPLEERDTATRMKREAKAKQTPCRALATNEIRPGQSWTRYLGFAWDYPMCKPGTYEITVSRESNLEHPEKSVTVKSNTLTIVVPEPATCDL